MNPGELKLYGDMASPYVTRVILLARLKGMALSRPDVPGGDPRSAEFHVLNPLGKVPALEFGGLIIPESETICEYLEEVFPEPSVLPKNSIDRMRSRLTARITDLYVAPPFGHLLPHLEAENRDSAVVADVAAALTKAFGAVVYYMGPGPFCIADRPTLGDCALGPYIQLFKKVIFPAFPEISDPTQGEVRLTEWWRALNADPVLGPALDEYAAAVDAFMAAERTRITQHAGWEERLDR